jgi:hypothetical protein
MKDEGRTMLTCREVRRQIEELAAAETPAGVRQHLAGCPRCSEALAAARLAGGLLRVSVTPVEVSAGFAGRVVARVAAGPPRVEEVDMWRPAWGLVPTFAAILVGLFLWQQGSVEPDAEGYLPTEGISFAERLVLTADELTPETILRAVLEVNRP